ncbi:putative G-protein coupled receptor 142 isoform X2 [Athene noctua]|uniref:putative G-protein coupled receptor 142 isoform X2 n=1 Tax=Athene noctua TaxID=126797 RepID=UPI003EB87092
MSLCHVQVPPGSPDTPRLPWQPVRGGTRWSRCPTARPRWGPARRRGRSWSGRPAWSASSPSCITASCWGWGCQTAILARAVPSAFIHTVNVLEFTANHASIWVTVLLTVDRYVALCHPLRYRAVSYPRRTRKIIAAVFAVALATGIPFYWWLDMWRDADPPTALDTVLKWIHCVTIYFLPCSIFLATNSIIILKLKRRKRSGGGRPRLSKTTALLLAVTTVFVVLWAPRTIVMICHLYVASVKRDWRVHLALDIANMVAMLNTTLNFFLYCFVSQTFRRAVGEVLRAHPRHGPRPSTPRCPVALKPLELLDGTAL